MAYIRVITIKRDFVPNVALPHFFLNKSCLTRSPTKLVTLSLNAKIKSVITRQADLLPLLLDPWRSDVLF